MLRAGLWHRGFQRIISADAPAVGKDWSIEMPEGPEGIFYQPLAVLFTIVTSVAVANRALALVYAGGASGGQLTNVFMRSPGVSLPASTTNGRHCFMVEGPSVLSSDGAGQLVRSGFLPRGLMLKPSERIGTETFNIDVADQYSGIVVLLQQWVYEPPAERSSNIGDENDAHRVDTIKLTKAMERIAELLEAQQATP